MQVSNPNNVKIYNLSAGKSLPEWLTDRKKRSLQKRDNELRRRIQLIQDFDMPTVSNCIQMTNDNQYIFATGVYKPRVRCYDVHQMSMKFERCMDSEVVRFHLMSEDYSKILFLQNDRYIEFHSQQGSYYRTRIPIYGRDMAYLESTTDVYFVGAGPEVSRLNLELGRFLSPLKTNGSEVNCCQLNPIHELFSCGTKEGIVECWDPRTRNCAARLDCALGLITNDLEVNTLPAVTHLKYSGATMMAVGLSTGQVSLYELRMNRPLLIKDHNYGLPIKDIEFHRSDTGKNLILSMDKRILKIWNRDTGKAFTAIEPETALNDLCVVQDSGLIFIANEAPKILTYYIPELGQAPKWCSMLTSITEELEENPEPQVFDDYKFLTRTELDSLGLSHLIGGNLLRAEMHGFYIRMEIYHKAKAMVDPFNYVEYKKKQIVEKSKVESRIKDRSKLPLVNRQLAEKIMSNKKKNKNGDLMSDPRFAEVFTDPRFQVDINSTEYKLAKPVLSKQDKANKKLTEQFNIIEDDEVEGKGSGDDFAESSSDEDESFREEMRKQHRLVKLDRMKEQMKEVKAARSKPKFYEIKAGAKFQSGAAGSKEQKKTAKKSLGDRIKEEDTGVVSRSGSRFGDLEMTFNLNKSSSETRRKEKAKEHHKERKKIRRPAGQLQSKSKPTTKFWMGKKFS